MVKRLILCADNRSPYTEEETYYKYCVGLSQVYAKKHNVDFIFDELKTVPDGRHWAWARILLFAKYYPKYDEIIWLDSDATIINHDIDIFSLLKTASASSWERDASVQPILYACRDSPNRNDEQAKKCCTGILLLDCSNKAKVKEVLNDWWNDVSEDKFKQGFPYEQSVINDVWRIHPVKRNYVKGVDLDTFFYDTDAQAFIHLTGNFYLPKVQLHEAKKYAAKVLQNRKKKIGLFVRQQNFYASGCGQNCIFMRQSLELLGYTVDLLVENYDTKKSYTIAPDIAVLYKDLNKVNINDYELFIFGSVVPSQQFRSLAEAKCIKTVMFHCMNSMDALHIDSFTYLKKADGVPLFESNFHTLADEVWLTDHHIEETKTYIEVLNNYNVPVKAFPLIWSPLFVSPSRKPVYYESRTSPLVEFVIIEPNMNYWKNAWMPLMIAEHVNKHLKNLKIVSLFGAPEDKTALNELQIAKENKLTCFPRMQINEIVKLFAARTSTIIFLSHQYNVPLNYAYFDALSTGFPFIHNSKKLLQKGLGYYYETLEDASSAVQSIVSSYDADNERKKANVYLDTIHPGNKEVLQRFSDLLVPSTKVPKIHVVVLTVDKDREEWMKKQLKDANLPFHVEFFHGFTVKNSKEYLETKEKDALELNGTICCVRSYAALFNEWSKKDYDYLITLEDDVLLSKDFISEVYLTIENWESSIDYISLGINLQFNSEDLKKTKHHGNLYYENLPSIWGTQAMMFKPSVVKTVATMLHFQTVKELRISLETLKTRKLYRNRPLEIQVDALLPTLFRQGVLYPPIAIEGERFFSLINSEKNSNLKNLSNHALIDKSRFNIQKICIVVLSVNKERENWMRKQIQDLKIPFQVEFFQGFTPETSKDYLLSKEENEVARNSTICITRSYAALFNEWSNKNYDYLITLEDDVLLSKDFVKQVESTIEAWKQHPSLEFVTLGVNLSFDPLELDETKCSQNLYYENIPSNWGAMAMMFTPTTVNAAAKALHFQTVKEVKESLYTFKSKKLYRNRALYVQIDAILPTIFKQGILYPPIAVESSNFISSKNGEQNTNQGLAKNHPLLRLDTFYKA